ncbi:hypothetical protein D3C71_1301010 [compost metagenome]
MLDFRGIATELGTTMPGEGVEEGITRLLITDYWMQIDDLPRILPTRSVIFNVIPNYWKRAERPRIDLNRDETAEARVLANEPALPVRPIKRVLAPIQK